jgi:hypothetical protein
MNWIIIIFVVFVIIILILCMNYKFGRGFDMREEMSKSYKNINSGNLMKETRRNIYYESAKEKRLQSLMKYRDIKRREIKRKEIGKDIDITKEQVFNCCNFYLYMAIKCPYTEKLKSIHVTKINFAKAVYKIFEIYNNEMERNINITFKLDAYKDNDEILTTFFAKLPGYMQSTIRSRLLPTIDTYNMLPLSNNIERTLERFKSYYYGTQTVDYIEIDNTIAYLVNHSDYLEINQFYYEPIDYKSKLFDYSIIMPTEARPVGIFTNLNDEIKIDIYTDDELKNSFNITSEKNCFEYIYESDIEDIKYV